MVFPCFKHLQFYLIALDLASKKLYMF